MCCDCVRPSGRDGATLERCDFLVWEHACWASPGRAQKIPGVPACVFLALQGKKGPLAACEANFGPVLRSWALARPLSKRIIVRHGYKRCDDATTPRSLVARFGETY